MTNANPTAVLIFSKATLSAIKLAASARTAKEARQAEFAAYANARAAGRAALSYLAAVDR